MISIFLRGAAFCVLLLILTASCLAQTGTGLTGKYYDDTTFATAVTTRTDASINFNFASAIPAGTAITAATTYSIAWSGQIEAAYSELYTFYVTADDAARLWVDDQLIVQRTFYQTPTEIRGQIRLKAGHRVNVRLEFIQQGGPASVKLEWASASQTKQVVPTNRLYTTTEVPNGGSVMREVWTGLPGASISTMTSNANYPNKPASREFLTSFECLAQSWEDNFGTRVTGFIRAPVSGSYTFAVSGDEVVQLYLSTDATAANKTLIASTTTATAFRDFAANASQQSAPRTLVAGQRYYVEVLHKEDTGADHWSVGWKQPGDAAFTIIPGSVLMMPGTDTAQPSTANFFNTLATEQPRLGVSRERFLWLKQMWESPNASAAKTRAQSVINSANNDLTAALQIQRAARDMIQRLAFAWWMTGDSNYAEAAWLQINNSINNGDWTDPWKGVEDGVVAIGYDWLYPYWSQARKDAMTSCMINKGFNPGWTDSYSNNIGVILNSGHLEAMLAVGLVHESAAEGRMGMAISRLNSKVDKWNVNAGAWYEGTDYGIFTKWGFGQAMPAMEMALGSTFGLSRIVGVSAAAKEPLTIASNNRQRFTFSDVGTGSEAAIGWANWFARRFNALETFDYSRQIGNSPLNALTLPEATLSPASTGMNPDTAFRGPADASGGDFCEVVTMRQNWTDSKATFVGGMGGTYDSHGHLQSGTFQLSARGVKWFVDLTSEDYSVPNHNTTTPNPSGPDRWDYYRWRAEGHNCLIVNPTANPDRIWNAPYAPMIAYQSAQNGQRSFAIWDLTNNITGVTKVQRGIQLLGQRKQVLVQDEIVHPTATTCWWFGHFRNDQVTATIGSDGTSVTLQNGTERLWGKIVSGGGTWTVRAARPLPTSPNPAEANPNTNYSKLAIQLTNVTSTTLAVWFVPLAPGEVAPTTTPTITALNTWNLVAQNEAPLVEGAGAVALGGAPADVELRDLASDDWTPATQMIFTVSNAVGGTVALLADGHTARFTPTPGFTGAQSFTFTARDADGATSSAATIRVGTSPNWSGGASGTWSAAANWDGGVVPVSDAASQVRIFDGLVVPASTVVATNDLAAPTQLNVLKLGGTGTGTETVSVAGNAFDFTMNGSTAPTVQLAAAGLTYTVANAITLSATTTFAGDGAGTFVFNGALGGSGGLQRTGTAATLVLNGANTFTGPVTNSAGTLRVGAASGASTTATLATAASITNHGTLIFRRTSASDVDLAGSIAGTGSVVFEGSGTTNESRYTVNNASTWTGGTSIGLARVNLSNATGLGSGPVTIASGGQIYVNAAVNIANALTIAGNGWTESAGQLGALRLNNGAQISGPITLAANTRLCAGSGSATFTGGISGPFALEIGEDTAAGTVVLSAANTHTGDTTVSFGTLDLATTGSLKFFPAANGLCNNVTGNGTASFKGAFFIDVTNAALASGNAWTLVNVATLNDTFAATFNIPGFTESANVWTRLEGQRLWTFSEATGVLSLSLLTAVESWRQQYFGTTQNTGNAADLFDGNGDGESNLMEFATGQSPTAATTSKPALVKNGATLELTYTRSLAAMNDGVAFTPEWRDDLAAGAWSNVGVTEQILSDNGTVQTVRASVAAGSGARRFLHLNISKP